MKMEKCTEEVGKRRRQVKYVESQKPKKELEKEG